MILGDWRLKLSHTPRSKEVSAIGLPRWSNGQDSMLPNTVAQGLIPGQRAAAAAKLRQSCLTLCDRIDGSPTGSSVPGILQARILEWVAISFSNAWKWKVKVKLLSRARFLATHGLQPTRLLCPWDFPGKSTGVGCHCPSKCLKLFKVKKTQGEHLGNFWFICWLKK